jgi:uncharacterized membrane protein (UPF0127 family)
MHSAAEPIKLVFLFQGPYVAEHVIKATAFFSRLAGLLGQHALPDDSALWLQSCTSVHTFGMRFPIDIVLIDASLKITGLSINTPPWRVRLAPRGTQSVIELAGGRAAACSLSVDDQLAVCHSTEVELLS